MLYQAIENSDTLQTVTDTVQQTVATVKDTVAAAQESGAFFDFDKIGSDGITITVVGYVIVFAALLILFTFISNLTKILNINLRKKLRASGDVQSAEKEDLSLSGEVGTAIATAIHLHFAEAHDFEHTVLTINKVQKTYSPWSSKIYGLRQYPNKITKSAEWN